MTIYETSFFGDVYKLRADFTQATDSIMRDDEDGDWIDTGKQVADFAHRPEDAMRWELDEAVMAGGDNPYDPENISADEIETAISEMITTKERQDMTQLHDTIDYEDAEAMDDQERDDWRQRLAYRDLATYDTGGELTIGWLYGCDGEPLTQSCDDVFSSDQPQGTNWIG
jgi:hypothetical protein